MKLLSVLFSAMLCGSLAFAAPTKKPASTTTVNKVETQAFATSNSAQVMNPSVHISTSINGLISGNTNIHANLFFAKAAAFSLGYASMGEKTSPIKKASFPDGTKLNVQTSQITLGGAYYILPHDMNKNFIVNPYLVFERKSDAAEVENNTGFGVRADGIYKVNRFALNAGLQSNMITGSSTTTFLVGAGYIF